MAWSHELSKTTGNKVSETVTTITLGAGEVIPAGSVIVGWCAQDNSNGAAGADPWNGFLVNGVAAPYIFGAANTSGHGAALDGVSVDVHPWMQATALGVGDTISVSWVPSGVVAKVFGFTAWSGGKLLPFRNAAFAALSATWNTQRNVDNGNLCVLVVGNESGIAPTAPSDTTNGSWVSRGAPVSGGSGGDATKMAGICYTKVVTASGTQNPTAGAGANTDWVANLTEFTLGLPQRRLLTLQAVKRGSSY